MGNYLIQLCLIPGGKSKRVILRKLNLRHLSVNPFHSIKIKLTIRKRIIISSWNFASIHVSDYFGKVYLGTVSLLWFRSGKICRWLTCVWTILLAFELFIFYRFKQRIFVTCFTRNRTIIMACCGRLEMYTCVYSSLGLQSFSSCHM